MTETPQTPQPPGPPGPPEPPEPPLPPDPPVPPSPHPPGPPEPPIPPDPALPPEPPEPPSTWWSRPSANFGEAGHATQVNATQVIEEPTLPFSPPYEPPSTSRPIDEGHRRRVPRLALIVALVAGLIGGGLGAGLTYAFGGGGQTHTVVNSLVGTSAQGSSATGATGSVEQVASLVLPSVVSIRVRTSGGVGEGSGIIISSDGLILTNNHVVSDAAGGGGVAVTFNDGTSKQASVVGTDPTSDLAVIKVPGVTDLKPAALGRSADLVVGQPVVAIGSPLGLSGTVTSGIVSALNRPVSTGPSAPSPNQQNTVLNAIQTDAAINPGNSGGPLVNMQGQVVGINSAIATNGSSITGQAGSIGVGFAIPIDEARPIADQLVSSGKADHPLLGVRVKDALGLLGVVPEGAAIVDITSGGAADKAGLRVGDIITKLNDRTIDTADALVAAVRAEKVGAVVKITYLRNGATETTSLTLGSQGG